MQKHPFDGTPQRNPEIVRRATNLIAGLDPDEFESLFGEFCTVIQTTADKHADCQHMGPMVIIGIDLNDDMSELSAFSNSQTVDASPVEPRLHKPDGLTDYDVIGMVQAHEHLDTPAHIQGALIEQLSTQWHILMMLEEMPAELHSSVLQDNPFEPQNTPGNMQPRPENFDQALNDLFEQISQAFNTPPQQPPNRDGLRQQFNGYDDDELDHLNLTPAGIQCEHCGAVYNHDSMDEAVQCCPSDDNDGVPLDEQDPDFDE